LVTVYRTQFGQQVKDGGIKGLIAFLQSKNKSSAPVAKPAGK